MSDSLLTCKLLKWLQNLSNKWEEDEQKEPEKRVRNFIIRPFILGLIDGILFYGMIFAVFAYVMDLIIFIQKSISKNK